VQPSGVTDTLESVFPRNADTAFAVGQNGKVLRSTNQAMGAFSSANPLNGIFARNDSLYMVGNGPSAFRSRDGGLTWDSLTGPTQNLNSVFSTGNNAYMVGQNGVAYYINHLTALKAVTTMTTNVGVNLHSIWGSPTLGSNKLFASGDSGTLLLFVAPFSNPWISLSGNLPQAFRGVNCAGGSADCWTVGDDETVLRTTNGTDWYQQTSGAKIFDKLLTYKRMRAGTADTVLMQAMDRDSPLRGYEKQVILNIPAGKDTTLNNVGLTRCGYSGPACTP
jgi:hypothetical protein